MSKKKKKIDNYWGCDIDNGQEDILKDFEDLEKGKIDSSEYRKSNETIFQNSLDAAIFKAVYDEGDVVKNALEAMESCDPRVSRDEDGPSIDIGYMLDEIENGEMDDTIMNSVRVNDPVGAQNDETLRGIKIKLIPELDRLIIDDGIAPSSFTLKFKCEQTDAMRYVDDNKDDQEEIEETITDFLNFFIILKHPSAIYTIEEFKSLTSSDTYDIKRFHVFKDNYMLYKDNNFVYAYKINIEEFADLTKWVEYNSTSLNDILVTYCSIAFALNRADQGFLIGADYVSSFINSNLNQKREFMNYLVSVENADQTVDDSITFDEIDNIEEIHTKNIEALEFFYPDIVPDFDDEDDDDDDIEIDDEDDVEEADDEIEIDDEVDNNVEVDDVEEADDEDINIDDSEFDKIDELAPQDASTTSMKVNVIKK